VQTADVDGLAAAPLWLREREAGIGRTDALHAQLAHRLRLARPPALPLSWDDAVIDL